MKKKAARKKPSVRKSYHRGNVAQDLLTAAMRILEKERFEDMSARRLCREIGVSISNFYNHFASFDDFLLVIATKGFERRMERNLRVVEQAGSREEALIELAQGLVDFAIEHHQMFRLMFGQVEGARDADRVLQSNKSFAVIVQAIYGQDIFRLDDLAWSRVHCVHAYAFISFFYGLARLISLGHIYLPENSVAERRCFVEEATRGFIRGLPPEKRATQTTREKSVARVKVAV